MTEELKKTFKKEMDLLSCKTSLALLETISVYPDNLLRGVMEHFIGKFKEEIEKLEKNDKT